MDPLVVWTLIFIASAAFCFVVEIAVPSGGLLGLLSIGSLIGAIVCLFMIDPVYGWIGVGVGLVLVPTGVIVGLRVFPHTPIGRRLILADGGTAGPVRYSSTDVGPPCAVGDEGRVESELHPVGVVNVGGRRLDCRAEHGVIEPGTRVKVIAIDGIEITVRPA